MHNLQACIACLRTDVKIFHMSSNHIREDYNLVTGLKTFSGEGLPEYVCVECLALVKRMKNFRDKCHRSHYLLHEILDKNKELTLQVLKEVNLKTLNITPSLSYLSNPSRNSYETVKFKWKKENRSYVEPIKANVLLHSTVDNEVNSNEEVEAPEPKCVPQFNVNFKDLSSKVAVSEESIKEPNVDEYNNDNETYDHNQTDCHNDIDGDTEIDGENDIAGDNDIDKQENGVDGSNLDEEYAILVPISKNESAVVMDIYKTYVQSGKYECEDCGIKYCNENRLEHHRRMHNMYINGNFMCELCHYYYKTKFLLETHITEKHRYKYICRKCPEVSFDRATAKKHYTQNHMNKAYKTSEDWFDVRPSWLKKRCPNGQRLKKQNKTQHTYLRAGFEFLKYSPIQHNEQYSLVLERRNSKNYVESLYKCDLCYKGFREQKTYEKHMQKHDPSVSGKYQCDSCKIYCTDARKMYKHMVQTHLYKFTCQLCSFVSPNRYQAKQHYLWHKNVTYACPHCDKVFRKSSTRLTHIRLKHPSLFVCNLCGHSFVSEVGLVCHKRIAHADNQVEGDGVKADAALFCVDCDLQFMDEDAYNTHLGSSGNHAHSNVSVLKEMASKNQSCRSARRNRKRRQFTEVLNNGTPTETTCDIGSEPGRPVRQQRRHFSEVLNNGASTETACEICDKQLFGDTQARKHYDAEHPGAEFRKRYMCDICGHTTRQYSNLLVHMRTHTREKPYSCPHCERRFSMPSNRDRHIVVHTGEKRHECPHCFRRFSQRTAMKLHVQTVHLKIPYAPWNKSNRRRRQKDDEAAPHKPPALPALAALPAPDTHDYLNAYISYNE